MFFNFVCFIDWSKLLLLQWTYFPPGVKINNLSQSRQLFFLSVSLWLFVLFVLSFKSEKSRQHPPDTTQNHKMHKNNYFCPPTTSRASSGLYMLLSFTKGYSDIWHHELDVNHKRLPKQNDVHNVNIYRVCVTSAGPSVRNSVYWAKNKNKWVFLQLISVTVCPRSEEASLHKHFWVKMTARKEGWSGESLIFHKCVSGVNDFALFVSISSWVFEQELAIAVGGHRRGRSARRWQWWRMVGRG